MEKAIYRIDAQCFSVKITVDQFSRVCIFAPPIVRYMRGWKYGAVEQYCRKKGWKLHEEKTGAE